MRAIPFLFAIVLLVGCSAPSAESPAESKTATSDSAKSASPAAPITPVSLQKRDVVRRARLGVRVVRLEDAERKAQQLLAGFGGFVESAESSDLDGAKPTLSLAVRVPVANFDRALAAFEGLGQRTSKRVEAQDVTAQIADQGARLETLQAHEASLRNMLKQADNSNTIMEAQRRITDVRAEIESLAAQQRAMAGLASLSTIALDLEQSADGAAAKDPQWAQEAWAGAMASAQRAFQSVASMAMWVIVYSPLWAVGYLVWRGIRRRFDQATPTA